MMFSRVRALASPQHFNVLRKSWSTKAVSMQGVISPEVNLPEGKSVVAVHFAVQSEDNNETSVIEGVPIHAWEDFQAKANECKLVYNEHSNARMVLVGLGKRSTIDATRIRDCTNAAMTFTKKTLPDNDTIVFNVPKDNFATGAKLTEWMTQSSLLSNYQFDHYKKNNDDDDRAAKTTTSVYLRQSSTVEKDDTAAGTVKNYRSIVDEQVILAEETLRARDLGNERADVVDPAFIEQVARESASSLPNLKLRVIQAKECDEIGLNMLLAVGQAASCPPRLVILEYEGTSAGDDNTEDVTALVGKGITFDTGGLNLKPTGFIEDMHMDMCGSAAVLGAIRAAARLGLKKKVVAVLALAENAIGSKAVKPHAILKSYDGKTVEVNNTDAEGRLVLADAMSFVQESYNPKTLVDVATLTGACVVALGEYSAGVFSNDDAVANSFVNVGKDCHERCWHLPILPEHTAELSNDMADTRSTGKGRTGGASTAAAFLQKFVKPDVKWAHVDIAGPAMYSASRSYVPKGATGFGVELLYKYLK